MYILVMMECQFGQYLFRLVQEIRPDAGVSGITEYTHPLPPASDLIGTVRDPSAGFGLLMHRRARASMLLPLRISFSTLVNATTWRRDSSAHLRDEEFLKAFLRARFQICNAGTPTTCVRHGCTCTAPDYQKRRSCKGIWSFAGTSKRIPSR